MSLNGALNEYYTYVLLEGVTVDANRVADFMVGMAEAMVLYLGDHEIEPVLSPGDLPELEVVEEKMRQAMQRRIDAALNEIEAHAATLADDRADEIHETIAALRATLATDDLSRVVLQGLLANLRELREVQPQRKTLAYELGLRLV